MEKKIYSLHTNVGYFYNRPIGYSRSFHQEYDEIFIQPDLNLKRFDCRLYVFAHARRLAVTSAIKHIWKRNARDV